MRAFVALKIRPRILCTGHFGAPLASPVAKPRMEIRIVSIGYEGLPAGRRRTKMICRADVTLG
jgi:hypothetical protein